MRTTAILANKVFFALRSLTLLVLVAWLTIGTVLTQDNTPPEFVPDEVLVKFRPGTAPQTLSNLNGALGATIIGTFVGDSNLYHIMVPSGVGVSSAITFYKTDQNVAYAEPNYVYTIDAIPDDPRFGELWGMAKIQAPDAWDFTIGAPDVVIGVTDTGIDYNHPDLVDNLWTNPNEVPDNGLDDDGNGYIDDIIGWDFAADHNNPIDNNNHGSHTSGTIAAVGNNGIGVTGVLWQAKIMTLKMCPTNSCSTAAAVRAIDYARENGAWAINASWGGGGFSQSLKDALDRFEEAGLIFVAAAGNNNRNTDAIPFYPAGYANSNIISVAATTSTDARAGFSNYGALSVDLGAPGSGILSTIRNGNYASLSGTSMAAPHVAGAVGLVWNYNPYLSVAEVKSILLDSADPVASLQGITVSGGRLNLYNAILLTPAPQVP